MINAFEIGTLGFAFVFYASLIVKQHIAIRRVNSVVETDSEENVEI